MWCCHGRGQLQCPPFLLLDHMIVVGKQQTTGLTDTAIACSMLAPPFSGQRFPDLLIDAQGRAGASIPAMRFP